MREVLSSKIHMATVTESNLDYIGSITIDEELMDKADLWPGQKVLVVSNTSGARLETYTIKGERNSGVICMNGACSHLIKKGEQIIIIGFQMCHSPGDITEPKCILVDSKNSFIKYI